MSCEVLLSVFAAENVISHVKVFCVFRWSICVCDIECSFKNKVCCPASRRRSCRVSSMTFPSLYFVTGLSSISNFAGLLTTGILSSSASDDIHVSTLAPVSAAMYSASVDEYLTVACRADDHTIGCFNSRTSSPVVGRFVSRSAAYYTLRELVVRFGVAYQFHGLYSCLNGFHCFVVCLGTDIWISMLLHVDEPGIVDVFQVRSRSMRYLDVSFQQ